MVDFKRYSKLSKLARTLRCPVCAAEAGQPCKSAGRGGLDYNEAAGRIITGSHKARRDAAVPLVDAEDHGG